MNDYSEFTESQPLEGEIFLSAEMAQQIAATVDWQPLDEISLYLIHGLLHLCGFDDLNEQDQISMRRQERQMLLAVNISIQPNDSRWNNLD